MDAAPGLLRNGRLPLRLPDAPQDFVYDGRIMAPRLRITARHTGTFLGIPATGRRVDITDHPHYRLENGKVAEYWDVPDLLTLMQQLGALPAPG